MIDDHAVRRGDRARDPALALRHALHVELLVVPPLQNLLGVVPGSAIAAPADERVVHLLVPSQRRGLVHAHALYARHDGLAPSQVAERRVRGDDVRVGGGVGRHAVAEHLLHEAFGVGGLAVGTPRVDGGVVRPRVRGLARAAHAHEHLLGVLRSAHVAQRGEERRVRLHRRAMAVGEEVLELAPDVLGIGGFAPAAALAAHGRQLLRGDVHGEAAAPARALLARVRLAAARPGHRRVHRDWARRRGPRRLARRRRIVGWIRRRRERPHLRLRGHGIDSRRRSRPRVASHRCVPTLRPSSGHQGLERRIFSQITRAARTDSWVSRPTETGEVEGGAPPPAQTTRARWRRGT